MQQLTMSTWNVFKTYQKHARPFDFLTVGIFSQDVKTWLPARSTAVRTCDRRACSSMNRLNGERRNGAVWSAAQSGTLTRFLVCAPMVRSFSGRCKRSIASA